MAKKKTWKEKIPLIPIEDLTNYFDLYLDNCAGYTTTKTMINQSGDKIHKRDVSGILDPIPPTIDGFFMFLRRDLGIKVRNENTRNKIKLKVINRRSKRVKKSVKKKKKISANI